MNLARHLAAVCVISIALSGCKTATNEINEEAINLKTFSRDEYVVMDRLQGEATSFTFWFLVIPFTFGEKDPQALKSEAYSNAILLSDAQQADGILEPTYTYKSTTVPLILVSWTSRTATVAGKAFRLKNEEEYQQSKVPRVGARPRD